MNTDRSSRKQHHKIRFSGDPRVDAACILVEALSGRSRSTDLLDRALRSYPADRDSDARLLHEIVMGVLRLRLALAAVVGDRIRGGIDRVSPILREVLLLMTYQALFLDRVPAYARVSTAVEAARRLQGEGAARLVNAVGRALEARLREGGDPLAGLDLWTRWSLPEPIRNRIVAVTGRDLHEDEAARLAQPAPTVFRVCRKWTTRDNAVEALRGAGLVVEPTRLASDGVVLDVPLRPSVMRGPVRRWIPGRLIPQDEASQLAVQVLDPRPGERVIDLCAGTGVKTTDILGRAPGAVVIAVDRDASRLMRARRLCRETGVAEPAFLCADALNLPEGLKGWADAVLVDAPCTGLGTIRRRPEVRYVRKEEDFQRASEVQRAILAAGLDLLRPAGRLVFAVCSFAREEGTHVVSSVLADRKDAYLEPIALPSPVRRPDKTALTLPWRDPTDGFFFAMLRKR